MAVSHSQTEGISWPAVKISVPPTGGLADLEVLATAIMAQVKGVGLQSLSESDNTRVDRIALQVAAEVEHWLAG